MLGITPDDIALLNDTDLRTLIGLLCASELRSRGLSATAVTWSGHQNTADGELEVRVALAEGETIEGFVPRANWLSGKEEPRACAGSIPAATPSATG